MIVAGMATIPSRAHVAPESLRTIAPQVDEVCLWLDGHDDQTRRTQHKHLAALRRGSGMSEHNFASKVFADFGDGPSSRRGAAWKWRAIVDFDLVENDDVLLLVDDDFAWPADYAATMLAALDRAEQANGRGCVVTCHGNAIVGRRWTTRGTRVAAAIDGAPHMRRLNVPGTGVLAARVGTVRNYPIPEGGDCLEDPRFGLWCQRMGIPIYAVPHRRGWLRDLLPENEPTLWAREGRQAAIQSVIDELGADWRLYGEVIDEPPKLHGIFR